MAISGKQPASEYCKGLYPESEVSLSVGDEGVGVVWLVGMHWKYEPRAKENGGAVPG